MTGEAGEDRRAIEATDMKIGAKDMKIDVPSGALSKRGKLW